MRAGAAYWWLPLLNSRWPGNDNSVVRPPIAVPAQNRLYSADSIANIFQLFRECQEWPLYLLDSVLYSVDSVLYSVDMSTMIR